MVCCKFFARNVCACRSLLGTTNSPMSATHTNKINPARNTEKTMRIIETPDARITVNSLLPASVPKLNKLPIKTAVGNNSYKRFGKLNKTYKPACNMLYCPFPTSSISETKSTNTSNAPSTNKTIKVPLMTVLAI